MDETPAVTGAAKFLRLLALVPSVIFHPAFFPFYAFALLLLFGTKEIASPLIVQQQSVLLFLLAITLLPVFFVMLLRLDLMLKEQRQRTIPYLFTSILYLAGGFVGRVLHLPQLIVQLTCMAAVAIFLLMLLNLKLKASMHAFSMGGMVGLLCLPQLFAERSYALVAGFILLLTLLVIWVRLHLKAHTPLEIAAGFFTGFAAIFLGLKIVGY